MSRKGKSKKDADIDFLEGYSFAEVLSGKIIGPEAFVPDYSTAIDKVEPKLSQSDAKVEPKPEPHHKPKLSQSEAKVEPQPEPLHKPKLSQSEAKVEPIGTFESLVGLQRNTLLFIFETCLISASNISGAFEISNLDFSL